MKNRITRKTKGSIRKIPKRRRGTTPAPSEKLKIENERLAQAISDHSSDQRKLQKSYDRMIKIVESTSDAFVSFDRNMRYTYMNSKAEEIENVKRDDVIGRKMSEIFPKVLHAPFYKRYLDILRSGQAQEFEEHFTDGRWYEIRVYPYEDGLSIYYRDITDRKQFEQRKDEFIGMASHELKTPITSLKLYTELLQDEVPAPQRKVYLGHMMTEVNRLSKLVGDLLDLSKMQVGKLQFQHRRFTLDRLVKKAVAMIQKTTKKHSIELYLPHRPVNLFGDEDRIEQVVLNLLTNAIKYSPNSERIVVKVSMDKAKACVMVRDFGVGIHPDAHKKIFNRFYQAASYKGNTFPGLGIGLYISKIIVDHHRGSFTVQSTPGKGTTITFALPLGTAKLLHDKKS